MPHVDADRNLLLGILAHQMDFVSRDALFAAMNAWIIRKETPLGALLVERGDLAKSRHALLEALVDEHVRAHGGDAARSLQALNSVGPVAQDLGKFADPDVLASVAYLNVPDTSAPMADSLGTRMPSSMGEMTSWNGRFRVVRPHARGGLGVVSVALDDELDREVAFKEIKERYADDDGRRARFVLEAEITGKLEHPGIIPIYGLGHDPTGRPFYAMRFIRGDSLADAIHRYHDPNGPYVDPIKKSLQLRELLGRFLDVCDALAYAHSRGVLHRDLKPGNVMLGPFGETLVVDWGLALPLERVPEGLDSTQGAVKSTKADSASLPSEQGSVVGTPAYMPPEQAEGAIDKLGPRSDVYGLGAILYDLLTGKRPVEGTILEEVLQRVNRGEIKPPRQVRPEVPAALEAVCLKALSHKPEDRYPTPRALAADIKAWLADEPVSARPEPFAERARRWAKRNRTAVAAAAATLLMGLVGLGAVATVQTRARNDLDRKNGELATSNAQVTKSNADLTTANAALEVQKRRAEDREAQAIAAVKNFGDVIANEPELKSDIFKALRKRLMHEPLSFFRGLRDRLLADRDTRPESLARLADACYSLGYLANEIGDKQDALTAYREALAIRQKLADDKPSVTEFQSGVAACHNNIGLLLSAIGKSVEALHAHRLALAVRQRLVDVNPRVTRFQGDLASSHNNIGNLMIGTGQSAEALKAHQLALAIRQRLADANPSVTAFQNDLAASHNNLGVLQNDAGQPSEALQKHLSALAVRQKLVDANPGVYEFRRNLASSYTNIGKSLIRTGQSLEALKAIQSALVIQQGLADANPSNTEFQNDLASCHNNIGNLLIRTGQSSDALHAHGLAVMIQQRLVEANPSVTEFQSNLASSHNSIGNLLIGTGQLSEALKALQSALVIQQRLAEANSSITEFQNALAGSYNNIGSLHGRSGQSSEALKALRSAVTIRQKLADANPSITEFQSNLASSHHNVGVLLAGIGELPEALKSHRSALEIRQKLAQDHPESPDFASCLGGTLNNLGVIDLEAKQFKDARSQLRQAVSWQRKALNINPINPTYRQFLIKHLASLLEAAQGLDDAEGVAGAERELAELRDSDPAMVALDARLSAIIKGNQQPTDNRERLQLAQRAYDKGLHATATRLWSEAIAADAKVAEDRQAQVRYNAACAASLAGCGQGKDEPAPDEAARGKLREQARGWLLAELDAWAKLVETGPAGARPGIVQTLQHWKEDGDLAGVREAKGLEALPEGEREAWRSLWAAVDDLLVKAQGVPAPAPAEGK